MRRQSRVLGKIGIALTGVAVMATLRLWSVGAENSDSSNLPGRELFAKNCTICHGENGDGQGKFAYLMDPRPRNLLAGKFKITTTENLIPSDRDLLNTIRRGMPGSAMPPWDHLPLADLRALVSYVRLLRYEAAESQLDPLFEEGAEELLERTKPGLPLRAPPEAPFDNLRWFNGRKVYLQACAICHGVDGHPVAEEIKLDDEGYPDPPRSFVNGIFKGGSEGHQLYARIIKGMRGTPMPAFEGTYDDDEIWDLIHYIQTLARTGAQERALLRSEVVVAARVEALPEDPNNETWGQARPAYVGLTPLWWTEKRIEGLVVQALHDGKELAIRLSWIDPTLDERAVLHEEFSDAVAIQFSLSSDPPFYMGSPGENGGVNMWLWKADREKNLAEGYQDVDAAFPGRSVDMYPGWERQGTGTKMGEQQPALAIQKHDPMYITAWGAGNVAANPEMKVSVESLAARGPGTLSDLPFEIQRVQGRASYDDGVWLVQMTRSLTVAGESVDSEERPFRSGDYIPVSFAVWDGSVRDRDGKKNISIWQRLVIE